MIQFNCPTCAKRISVDDRLAGRKGKCAGCGRMISVPTANAPNGPMWPPEPPKTGDTQRKPTDVAPEFVRDVQVVEERSSPSTLSATQWFTRTFGVTSGVMLGILAALVGIPVLMLALCGGCLVTHSFKRAVDDTQRKIVSSVVSSSNEQPGNNQSTKAAPARKLVFSEIIRDKEEAVKEGESLPLTQVQADAKWEKYLANLKGCLAEDWEGFVLNARERTFGSGYFLEVDSASERDGEVDIYLYVTKEQALLPRKGERIVFSGTITGLWTQILEKDSVEIECSSLKVSE